MRNANARRVPGAPPPPLRPVAAPGHQPARRSLAATSPQHPKNVSRETFGSRGRDSVRKEPQQFARCQFDSGWKHGGREAPQRFARLRSLGRRSESRIRRSGPRKPLHRIEKSRHLSVAQRTTLSNHAVFSGEHPHRHVVDIPRKHDAQPARRFDSLPRGRTARPHKIRPQTGSRFNH